MTMQNKSIETRQMTGDSERRFDTSKYEVEIPYLLGKARK